MNWPTEQAEHPLPEEVVQALDACENCGAPIFFAKTDKGKVIPLDADRTKGGVPRWRLVGGETDGLRVFVPFKDRGDFVHHRPVCRPGLELKRLCPSCRGQGCAHCNGTGVWRTRAGKTLMNVARGGNGGAPIGTCPGCGAENVALYTRGSNMPSDLCSTCARPYMAAAVRGRPPSN